MVKTGKKTLNLLQKNPKAYIIQIVKNLQYYKVQGGTKKKKKK